MVCFRPLIFSQRRAGQLQKRPLWLLGFFFLGLPLPEVHPQGSPLAQELTVVAALPTEAVIAFQCRGAAQLVLEDQRGKRRLLAPQDPGPLHLLLVSGLEPGATYRLALSHPGARPTSLAVTLKLPSPLSPAALKNRIRGGWLGKVIGNEFGLPFEQAGLFVRTRQPFTSDLKAYDSASDGVQGRIPANHYVNDDTGLAYISLLEVEAHGLSFTSRQLAQRWLYHLSGHPEHLWCAEPYAIKNFQEGIWPPLSGDPRHNPYSHHLDAQMRADIWGLLAPGRPSLAIQLARRDAVLSNHGEGVDGAVFVAAMTAAAFYEKSPEHLLQVGSALLPPKSLHRRIAADVLRWRRASPGSWRPVWQHVQKTYAKGRYQPHDGHPESMILAGPNAANIMLGLLYGAGDFSHSVGIAASAAWDTDCNAGNVGAIAGVLTGARDIPQRWKAPLHDEFSIRDFYGHLPQVLSILAIGDRIFRAAKKP